MSSVDAPGPRRLDSATLSYLAGAASCVALMGVLRLTQPGLLVAHGNTPAFAAGVGAFALIAVAVLVTGRIGPRSVHVIAVSTLAGGALLAFSMADHVLIALSAPGSLLGVMYLATTLPRRQVAAYTVLAAVAAVTVVLHIPGTPAQLEVRSGLVAGVIVLSMSAFLSLRGDLERATRAAQDLATRDVLTGLLNRRA